MEAISKNENQPSLSATISKIVDDSRLLLRQEIELAKTEVKTSLKATAGLIVGGISAAFGVVVFTVAVVALLADAGVPIGVTCMAFAIVYFGVALGLYMWFERKMKEVTGKSAEESKSQKNVSPMEGVQQENVRWLNNQT